MQREPGLLSSDALKMFHRQRKNIGPRRFKAQRKQGSVQRHPAVRDAHMRNVYKHAIRKKLHLLHLRAVIERNTRLYKPKPIRKFHRSLLASCAFLCLNR
jgi:hypothetical protein